MDNKSTAFQIGARGQVALIVLVVLIGIGGTALGALNVRSSILRPYEYNGSDVSGQLSYNLNQNFENTSLNSIDTDGDGLSDDEELNIYSTSPYLTDSDSDGVNDADEISFGSDPNCPSGNECGYEEVARINTENTQLPSNNSQSLSVNTTPSQLRDLLRSEGVSEEEINSLSDAEIMAVYYQTIEQQIPNNSVSVPSDYQNLSPSEIRNLLISQGVDSSVLDDLSDDKIVEIYRQSLNEN